MKDINYKCAVIDHDDTAVDSSESIHYPIYLEIMSEIRPNIEPLTADGFIEMNRLSGIKRYYTEDLSFDGKEWNDAYDFWVSHPLRKTIPDFYKGFLEMFDLFKSNGGIVAVVSHSDEESIRMHYNSFSSSYLLDKVIGASKDPSNNKPYTLPLRNIIQEFNLSNYDIIVIDDLDPGIDMAVKMDVDTIGVGWSHENPDTFKKKCKFYADKVDDLENILFENGKRLL